jgi:magnesium chelatase family protein
MFSDCSCRCSGIDYLTIRADDGWSLSRGSLRAPSTRRSRSAPRVPAFTFVGLPDKAVAESRERVRGALNAIGLGLPPKRITVNLAPADLPKEGSHYDLPIALGLMAAVGAVARDAIEGYCVLGELALDGSITTVAGALPAAIGANALGKGLICPASYGAEAAWAAADMAILAPSDLLQLINHFKGLQTLRRPVPTPEPAMRRCPT